MKKGRISTLASAGLFLVLSATLLLPRCSSSETLVIDRPTMLYFYAKW